jgi:uncharacterized protein YecE (DUF72 family)
MTADSVPSSARATGPRGRILVGTSGYSFRDWVGPFYPPGTRESDFLPYYSRYFDALELNSTYYGIPNPKVMEQIERKTPPDFRFVVKLNKAITHEGSLDPVLIAQMVAAVEPLKFAGKYDGLLAQFPGSFRRTRENRRHLAALREALRDEPLFVEFRHDSWLTPELEPSMREHRIGFCAVDEPRLPGLLPPVTAVTADDAYVRFHGRNAETWWSGDIHQRYDYDYRREELTEWLDRIAALAERARRTYLFFNNCHAGQAARSAKLMQELLKQQSLTR